MNYQRKLSGPIIDRIDLYVQVENIAHDRLLGTENRSVLLTSSAIKKRAEAARQLQAKQHANAQQLSADLDIKQRARLSDEAKIILDQAALQLDISPRSYMRTIKVARTISRSRWLGRYSNDHIAEAFQYRSHLAQLQADRA